MTEAENKPKKDTKDTSAARLASLASFARRRHRKWLAEMEAAGIEFTIPDNYTGLPLEER